jgi:FKBP-type peptidyl-prolyl cis-trans isomerase FkpA
MEEIEKNIASKKSQMDADSKIIEDYLTKNNVKAQKTKWGTFIAVSTEGTGADISSKDVAMVNYTGRTLDSGRVFDSNTDPKFKRGDQPQQALPVNISELGGIIVGWTDALLHLKKGSKATIYIPSTLGYGPSGNGDKIKPNENLVFDIEVVDVISEESYMAKMQAMQEEMMRKAQEQSQAPATADTIKKGK